jgi:flagellar hook assembly protein FlgD
MRIPLALLLTATVLSPLTANAIDVSGDQWGSWTKDNSPYNIVGEKVRTLVDARMAAGYYKAIWDGRNDAGKVVSSGIYLYRLKAGNQESIRLMSLLR